MVRGIKPEKVPLKIRLFAALIKVWLSTLRICFAGCPVPEKNALIGLWHGDLPVCAAAFRKKGFTVLISKSADGEIAARVCEEWGYRVFRGSTSNGGITGMKQLARSLTTPGSNGLGGMALDGPRGPLGTAQPGTAWLSGSAGIPVYPCTVEMSAGFRLNTWDRMGIPLPFSRVRICVGGPVFPKKKHT